ncbi:MAG: murein biosynthesis integral membrane protein MurJ [Anaerolineales bacterium]|nr:murein biosynthesis integral membrane protein MurJ [Anaerolineales bacterium]
MDNTGVNANRQIARAAGTVMVAFIISNLAGLARQILVARAFGTGAEMEAFNAANRVAETLFNLVAGGALASAFIPTFTGLITKGERGEAWKLASAISNLALVTLIVIAGLAALFARPIVHYILAPGFAVDPVKETLTIDLMRLMLPSAVIFGLSGIVMGVLNSHQVFLVPALTPALYQIGMIFGVTVLSPSSGIYGLAWGVVIGAALHFGVQLPSLLHQKSRYFPIMGFDLPAVREVLTLLLPRLFGVAVVQLNFWVNTRLASAQPEGSVTGVVTAFTLLLMPQAAIAQSIAIAAMPTLASQYALGKIDDLRASLVASLRGVLLLSLPASVGLMLLRKPIIILLYQRGEFDAHSTELVAWALLWYAVGLVGHCVVEILARAFYALHDTRTPVMVGAAAMILNILFSFIFSSLFSHLGWAPHGGLALANSLATALEMAGLLVLMQRRLCGLNGRRLLNGFLLSAIASIVMAGFIQAWLYQVNGIPAWLIAVGGILIGFCVYLLTGWGLRIPELSAGAKWAINKVFHSL